MNATSKKGLFRWWELLLIILIGLGLIYIIPLIVHCIYPVEHETPNDLKLTNVSAGDLLGFIGGYLAFIGTAILGLITVKNSKEGNKRIIELEEKNYILKNRLKLLNNDCNLRIIENWTTDLTDEVNGIAQLFYNSETRYNVSKNYILYLKYDNFVPPVKLKVNKIVIGKIPTEIGVTVLDAFRFYNVENVYNYGFISDLPNQLIPISFSLNYNRDNLPWLVHDDRMLTIIGEVDILSNEDVVSRYRFRFIYSNDDLDNVRVTTKLLKTFIYNEDIDV